LKLVYLFVEMLEERGIPNRQVLFLTIQLVEERPERSFCRLDSGVMVRRHIRTQGSELSELK
jgi:hypothetical protein